MWSCLKEPKVSRKRLHDENGILKESVEQLTREYLQTSDLNRSLSDNVKVLQERNRELSGGVSRLSEQNRDLERVVAGLSQENKNLAVQGRRLEEIGEQQAGQVERLKEELVRLIGQNDETETRLGDLKRMVGLFGNNVSDIEEKLFKTYYEYKNENRVQHQNNLLQIFINCDLDRDGHLDSKEFGLFRDYIAKVYGQEYHYSGEPISLEGIFELNIKPR